MTAIEPIDNRPAVDLREEVARATSFSAVLTWLWWRAAPWVVPAVLVVAWEALGRLGVFAPNLVPPPGAVVDAVVKLAADGELVEHVAVTLGRVAAGFVWGVAAATVLGVATGVSATARRLLDPTLQALKAVPSLAWVPLFILWFGIFEESKITLIAVGVFFPVYLNLMIAIRGADRKLVEVARINGLSLWATVRYVLVPGTLPAYVAGLRGGLALGWMFVVAAELMGASEGLGFLMIDGQMTGRPAMIIAALLLFAVTGKLTDQLLVTVAGRFLVWQDSLATSEQESSHA
ncbi:MAG: ABC transporter permease [Alphaproteobacteria bacterium]|nr:ABC transporter permease [Alphaproteobacteria bacterium]